MLFAHLIERYSGMPFTTFVSDRIFLPLKMSSTTYLPSIASATGRFTQNFLSNGRRIPNWFTDELVGLNAGPGGVISSTVDLARWVRFLLDDGANSAYNATGIPRSVVDECMRAHVIMPSDKPSKYFSGTATYGMGWFQDLYRGHRVSRYLLYLLNKSY
jgi:CubicO group peptidase (beta-lactamase class C family)